MSLKNTLYGLTFAAAIGIAACAADKAEAPKGGIEFRINVEELKRIQSENAPAYALSQVQYWQDIALSDAQNGKLWNNVETDIRIAEKYSRAAGIEIKVDWQQLERAHASGVKANGQKNVDYWVDEALRYAKRGELWDSVETNIRIAERYAKEAGINIEQIARIEEIKQMYAKR